MEKAQQKEASQDNDSADLEKAQETTKRKEPDGPILKGDTTDHDPPGSKRRQLSSDDFIEAKEEAALMKQVGEISSGHEEKRKMALEELQAKLPNMCSDQRKTVLVALAHAVLRGDGIIRLEEWKDQQLWDDGTGLAAVFRAALLSKNGDSAMGDLQEPKHYRKALAGELTLKDWGEDERVGEVRLQRWALRLENVLRLRFSGDATRLLGPDMLPPLHDRRRVMDGLLTLVNDRNRRVLRLVKDPKEWLGLIHWRGNRKVTLHLDQPVSGSASSVNLGRVELSLQQTVVRHATTNTSLLAMIHDAVSSEFLEFKAHASADQYTEVELAWFGIDPTSVPAIRAFRDASDNDGLRYERAALRDNRYGCVVLSFPLSTLFSGTPEPSLWQLGERQYTRELSQTVLLDPTGGPVAVYRQGNDWAIIGNQRLTLLSRVEKCRSDTLMWPYDIHYQPERWTHPEFAVQGGFRIRPDQGLRITFEPHGTGVCVKEKRGRTCHDCERRVKKTAQQARDDFLATVREGGLAAVMDVLQFLRAWPTAFTDADRAVLEAAMLPPLLREEEAPAQ